MLSQCRAPLPGRFIACKSWFIEALIYLRLCPQKFCFLLIRSSNCLIYYTMFQAHQLSSSCLFHVTCMYTTEEEPAKKLYLCWFLNTAARLSFVDPFISFIWPVHRSRVILETLPDTLSLSLTGIRLSPKQAR